MVILDQPRVPLESGGPIIWWRGYVEGIAAVSVPLYVEQHGKRLRAKYLAFLYDLGESRIAGKRVVDHLDGGDGFSFWWLTKLSEKSPFKSRRIFDCLRMLALEEILLQQQPIKVTLDSADLELAQAIRRLCKNLGVQFHWRRTSAGKQPWSLRRLYSALPYSLQGLISFRNAVLRWRFRRLKPVDWFTGERAVFMCSSFFNLDWDACASGRFYARQWEVLPDVLRESGKRINWLHHYLPDPGMPTVRKSLDWVQGFNRNAEMQGCHAFLETYLSLGVLFRVLKNWLWLNAMRCRLRNISISFYPIGSRVWLWPLLKDDWRMSLSGTTAVSNCFWIELFDAALKVIPRQQRGFYVWANQAWECALLRAWRRNGHGEIVGVPHSTMPFWLIDIYDDPRTFNQNDNCCKPLPDLLALNGPLAWSALGSVHYPVRRLVTVEALRFQYLASLHRVRREHSREKTQGLVEASGLLEVLILGDFTVEQTLKMIRCIHAARDLCGLGISLTFKPHPICSIPPEQLAAFDMQLTNRPLLEIVCDFQFAFCSNTTSAAIDALLSGLVVAVYLDDDDFNHSPMRGIDPIRFVSSAEQLAAVLREGASKDVPSSIEDFFWLDETLPRWRTLLLTVGSN